MDRAYQTMRFFNGFFAVLALRGTRTFAFDGEHQQRFSGVPGALKQARLGVTNWPAIGRLPEGIEPDGTRGVPALDEHILLLASKGYLKRCDVPRAAMAIAFSERCARAILSDYNAEERTLLDACAAVFECADPLEAALAA